MPRYGSLPGVWVRACCRLVLRAEGCWGLAAADLSLRNYFCFGVLVHASSPLKQKNFLRPRRTAVPRLHRRLNAKPQHPPALSTSLQHALLNRCTGSNCFFTGHSLESYQEDVTHIFFMVPFFYGARQLIAELIAD